MSNTAEIQAVVKYIDVLNTILKEFKSPNDKVTIKLTPLEVTEVRDNLEKVLSSLYRSGYNEFGEYLPLGLPPTQ